MNSADTAVGLGASQTKSGSEGALEEELDAALELLDSALELLDDSLELDKLLKLVLEKLLELMLDKLLEPVGGGVSDAPPQAVSRLAVIIVVVVWSQRYFLDCISLS